MVKALWWFNTLLWVGWCHKSSAVRRTLGHRWKLTRQTLARNRDRPVGWNAWNGVVLVPVLPFWMIRFSIFARYRILCPWQTSETARQATSALFKHGPIRWLSQSASIYQQTSVLLRMSRDFVKCNYDFDMYWLLIGCFIFIHLLVGGLEHFLFSPIVGMMIQSDFHIFQGGRYTTN